MRDTLQEKQKRIELRYLYMFTFFIIFVLMYLKEKDFSFIHMLPEAAGLLVGWIFYGKQYFSFQIRIRILLAATVIAYLVYGIATSDLSSVLVFYGLLMMLVSAFENHKMSYVISGACLGIIFLHTLWFHTIDLEEKAGVIQFVSMLCIVLMMEVVVKWRVQSEQEKTAHLQQVITGLRDAEQAKDDFLANISHELRTPLNTVSGMSDLLLEKELDRSARSQVFDIKVAGKRLQNLISDIMDYTQLQSEKVEVTESNYNLSSVLNDVVNMIMADHKKDNVEFIIDCDASIPSGLLGDADKIRRILYCIVENAFKFTEQGFVSLRLTARREFYGVNLLLIVKDSGIGMSPEIIEKILDRYDNYTQADAKENRKKEGIGLGLTIVRSMVELMGGFMHIESSLGQGSEIKVMIPQKVIDEKPLISVKNPEKLNLAVYVDSEKYSQSDTLGVYLKNYEHMGESLGVSYVRCQSMAKLKYGVKRGRYTHIFMSAQEYLNSSEFFDEISKTIPVILVMEKGLKVENSSMHLIDKPFSVFHIAAALNGEQVEEGYASHNSADKFIAEDAKVLAVDDNSMNLKVLQGLLKEYRIEVIKALSGVEAIELVQKNSYDLIFMDHMMPGMDGIEAFHEIRRIPNEGCREVPIVALTANAVNGAREMFLKEGFQDYIAKPIDPSLLRKVLRKYLAGKIQELEVESKKEEAKNEAEKENLQEFENKSKAGMDQTKAEPVASAGAEENVEEELIILDEKIGVQYCADMVEMYLEFLPVYLENSAETMVALEQALEDEDVENYRTKVHSLKSTSLQIGAVSLSELAKASEMACKEGDFESARKAHPSIVALHERVVTAIHERLERESEG